MTQEAKLHEFWNSFDIPAFPNNAVISAEEKTAEAAQPLNGYITYQQVSGYNNNTVSETVQVWMYTENLAALSAKVDQIAKRISGGIELPCDNGAMLLRMGTPWSVPTVANVDEPAWKMRQLNVSIEFLIYV